MSGIIQALVAGGVVAHPTPTVWSTTDGNAQTISGGGLIATFASTGNANRAAVRVTSSRSTLKRQCNFRFPNLPQAELFGLSLVTETNLQYPGFGNDGMGLHTGNGNVYVGNSPTSLTSALSAATWYCLVFDTATGAFSVYTAGGSLLGTVTNAHFAGVAVLLHCGSGSGTVTGTLDVEIDPAPTTLYGGAIAWDT